MSNDNTRSRQLISAYNGGRNDGYDFRDREVEELKHRLRACQETRNKYLAELGHLNTEVERLRRLLEEGQK